MQQQLRHRMRRKYTTNFVTIVRHQIYANLRKSTRSDPLHTFRPISELSNPKKDGTSLCSTMLPPIVFRCYSTTLLLSTINDSQVNFKLKVLDTSSSNVISFHYRDAAHPHLFLSGAICFRSAWTHPYFYTFHYYYYYYGCVHVCVVSM